MYYSTEYLRDLLRNIESEHSIGVIYGVESGSRAWGFESQNSDYDIRFLYVRPIERYLSLEKPSNTLELRTSSDLDLSGWDLRKALLFLRKSHPVLLEWLRSPIVYTEQLAIVQQMRDLGEKFFSPRASIYHYVSWAEHTLHRYFQQPEVAAKRYLYVMRPLLCCRWIQTIGGQPPLQIQTLIAAVDMTNETKAAINTLIMKKSAGYELGIVGRIPALDRYIYKTLPQIKTFLPKSSEPVPFESLDSLFYQALEEFSAKRSGKTR